MDVAEPSIIIEEYSDCKIPLRECSLCEAPGKCGLRDGIPSHKERMVFEVMTNNV